MNDERRSRVLRAIVEDYVATNEPVGSKALVERHKLGVSSATIRNDMAALEQEGLIAQPHTSAGRIPTDAGYRAFVDRIDDVKPLSSAEKRAISQILSSTQSIDDTLARTVRLLSRLTHQVALIQYPVRTQTTIRRVELVQLSPERILVILITDTGEVEQRIVEALDPIDEDDVRGMRRAFNEALEDTRLDALEDTLSALAVPVSLAQTAAAIAERLVELARSKRQDRLIMAGAANLARAGSEFGTHMGPLLEAIEEQVVLLKLLADMQADGIAVQIGSENRFEALAGASLIATGYGTEDTTASLAVLGPTRMDYPTTMAAVRAVAKYVSTILSD